MPDFRDGFFSDYPDTPRFVYGGEDQRLIYDRKQAEREANQERREDPRGSGPDHNEPTQDLFS